MAEMELNTTSGICLDSNIFVRFYAPDEHCAETDDFFSAVLTAGRVFYAPSLMQFEFAQTLGKKERQRMMSSELVAKNMRRFCSLPILLEWNEALLEKSLELYRTGFKSLYDAAFLALAVRRKIPLVTEDREIIARGRKVYAHVYTMRESLRLMGMEKLAD